MATESSLTRKLGEKKKPQLGFDSYGSSLLQRHSDVDSTSSSSSMQDSTSSTTSSTVRYTNSVKQETLEKKALKKSFSKKIASFGSFITSRRRAQSKLNQSSPNLYSDDGPTTPSHPTSIEVSDESSNYIKKPMPKFTRNGSLRSVKIFRTNSKNRNKNNKPISKSKKSSTDDFSQIAKESHSERATFSSILKDSKFPEHLKHQPKPAEPEEPLPVAKFCTYHHCSLHGHHHHHHHHEPPTKRFEYLKKRTTNESKIANHQTKKSIPKVTKKASDRKTDVDFSIEFYAKTRPEPVSTRDHDDAELADILFGINSLKERNETIPGSYNRDSSGLNNENDEISKGFLGKNQSLKKKKHVNMWGMIHQHMVSGLAAETGDVNQIDHKLYVEQKSEAKDFDDSVSRETEIRIMFAIKLVRDAIEKILLPEVQDDRSITSEVPSEHDLSQNTENQIDLFKNGEEQSDVFKNGEKQSDRKDESPATVIEENPEMKSENGTPNRWSNVKKVILLKKFVEELEKVKKFDPKKSRGFPMEAETEAVSLRRRRDGGRKRSDEWMLDYALQKVLSELAPTQKRKVALLVKAFETVAPAQDNSQESKSYDEIQQIDSNPESKPKEITESKPDLQKETRIKMWHTIYQHVATDIATRIGSDLLDEHEDAESPNSKHPNQPITNYKHQFTQTDAINLIQQSLNQILHPDTQSDQEQQQKLKNRVKLKELALVNRSIRELEGSRRLKSETPEDERVDLRSELMDERKKAEEWMVDYAIQHVVSRLTPSRSKRVSMLVEAFETVVPLPGV